MVLCVSPIRVDVTLSNHMTARDSNRGGCCQSCRWDYELLEVDDNGELDVFYNQGEVPFCDES